MKEIIIDGVEYTLKPKVPEELKVVQRFIDIEVYPEDAPKEMRWDRAASWCQNLGDGWRLPDRLELIALYEQRYIIGGFWSDYYWSRSLDNDLNLVFVMSFFDNYQCSHYMIYENSVRAVRSREVGE